MKLSFVFVAMVALLAPVAVWLQGCGATTKPMPAKPATATTTTTTTATTTTTTTTTIAKPSGTTQSGVNVLRGGYSGVPIASSHLPTVEDANQIQMSSMIAFSSDQARHDMSQRFGIDISGIANAFSGSAELQRSREELDSTSTMHIEGELFVTMIKKTSSISPETILALTPALSDAIRDLPNSSRGDDNMNKFVTFFNIHGSHFLSKVFLGGKMHLKFRADMQRSVASNQKIKHSFVTGAKGTFQSMVELPVDIAGRVQASRFDIVTFESSASCSQQDLTVTGGDPTTLTWNEWKHTVDDHLSSIHHEYSSMDMVLREMQNIEHWTDENLQARLTALQDALQSVLGACPDECSGHGLCDFRSKTCKCDYGRAGFDCSGRMCAQSCGEHGACDERTGLCICDDGWAHEEPSDSKTPCTKYCGHNQLCHGECIRQGADCCDDGRTCPPGTQCCGDLCCDFCESGAKHCPQDAPHCCDSACGLGHSSPGLCCSNDAAWDAPCAQWPLCHCSLLAPANSTTDSIGLFNI